MACECVRGAISGEKGLEWCRTGQAAKTWSGSDIAHGTRRGRLLSRKGRACCLRLAVRAALAAAVRAACDRTRTAISRKGTPAACCSSICRASHSASCERTSKGPKVRGAGTGDGKKGGKEGSGENGAGRDGEKKGGKGTEGRRVKHRRAEKGGRDAGARGREGGREGQRQGKGKGEREEGRKGRRKGGEDGGLQQRTGREGCITTTRDKIRERGLGRGEEALGRKWKRPQREVVLRPVVALAAKVCRCKQSFGRMPRRD
eukprot:6171835-Pleurochrysis_carterae.AAC.2